MNFIGTLNELIFLILIYVFEIELFLIIGFLSNPYINEYVCKLYFMY
jgi:hypothetical protein